MTVSRKRTFGVGLIQWIGLGCYFYILIRDTIGTMPHHLSGALIALGFALQFAAYRLAFAGMKR